MYTAEALRRCFFFLVQRQKNPRRAEDHLLHWEWPDPVASVLCQIPARQLTHSAGQSMLKHEVGAVS